PVLALRTIMAIAHYVTGFVLQEQTERQEDAEQPAEQVAELAELLDGGASATLAVAVRDGGSPLGEDAFEHGLRVLINGTAAARTACPARQGPRPRPRHRSVPPASLTSTTRPRSPPLALLQPYSPSLPGARSPPSAFVLR